MSICRLCRYLVTFEGVLWVHTYDHASVQLFVLKLDGAFQLLDEYLVALRAPFKVLLLSGSCDVDEWVEALMCDGRVDIDLLGLSSFSTEWHVVVLD